MCLKVKHGETIRVAEKDIVVYKRIINKGDHWIPPLFGGEFSFNKVETARKIRTYTVEKDEINGYCYHYKKEYPVNHLQIEVLCTTMTISEGFHSMLKKGDINSVCIIPRGSEYCLGNDGDIVSNRLIVFSGAREYNRYRVRSFFRSFFQMFNIK